MVNGQKMDLDDLSTGQLASPRFSDLNILDLSVRLLTISTKDNTKLLGDEGRL
jgi:hypothetical protein